MKFGGKARALLLSGPEQPWRRHMRTTREGKVFILFTLGVGLAAVNTGANLIFLVFGFMLSLIVLSGILSELVLRKVTVTRRLPERAFARAACIIELALHNGKTKIPSYALEVEDLAEGEVSDRHCYFLKVAGQAKQPVSYRRTLRRRGMVHFSGYKVATRYPFGMLEKWRNFYSPGDLLVYPALVDQKQIATDHQAADTEGTFAAKPGAGTEVAGVRDYVDGDDARRIHWMRSASLGRMVVREREREPNARLAIVLDNARPEVGPSEWDARFETAVSRAATLAVMGAANGLTVEVLTRGARSPLVSGGASVDPILRFLALIEAAPASGKSAVAEPAPNVQVVEVKV